MQRFNSHKLKKKIKIDNFRNYGKKPKKIEKNRRKSKKNEEKQESSRKGVFNVRF